MTRRLGAAAARPAAPARTAAPSPVAFKNVLRPVGCMAGTPARARDGRKATTSGRCCAGHCGRRMGLYQEKSPSGCGLELGRFAGGRSGGLPACRRAEKPTRWQRVATAVRETL